jgi:RecB family endonuclease NucS
MEAKKLIPYSVYLPEEHHKALKKAAKSRKASELIRDAIALILDGGKPFNGGYNQALRDVVKILSENKETNMIVVKERYLSDILIDKVEGLQR